MIVCMAALNQEVGCVKRSMDVHSSSRGVACRVYHGTWHGQEILLVRTGMGKNRVQAAIQHVLDRHVVSGVVSFGFAGALRPNLQIGDIVLVSELTHRCDASPLGEVNADQLRVAAHVHARAERALNEAAFAHSAGGCMTSDRVIGRADEKMMLSRSSSAKVVDMESFWIGAAAIQNGIPFVALRAVSDRYGDTVPPFDRLMTPAGVWRPLRAADHFVRHPHEMLTLARMARPIRRATSRLTEALRIVLSTLDVEAECAT